MGAYTVRRAGAGDVQAIARIEQSCFSAPWSEALILAGLQKENDLFYIAECGGEAAGYIGLNRVLDESYLYNLAVLPQYRRRGIGEALLRHACSEMFGTGASFVSLEVRRSNRAAIALYEKLGFQRAGERKDFYSAPTEDAVIMTAFRAGREEQSP